MSWFGGEGESLSWNMYTTLRLAYFLIEFNLLIYK